MSTSLRLSQPKMAVAVAATATLKRPAELRHRFCTAAAINSASSSSSGHVKVCHTLQVAFRLQRQMTLFFFSSSLAVLFCWQF